MTSIMDDLGSIVSPIPSEAGHIYLHILLDGRIADWVNITYGIIISAGTQRDEVAFSGSTAGEDQAII